MRYITIKLEDDRFDDMTADEVPALIFDMIRHDLWHLTDPWVHVSEIAVEVPPAPAPEVAHQLVGADNAAVNELARLLLALSAQPA